MRVVGGAGVTLLSSGPSAASQPHFFCARRAGKAPPHPKPHSNPQPQPTPLIRGRIRAPGITELREKLVPSHLYFFNLQPVGFFFFFGEDERWLRRPRVDLPRGRLRGKMSCLVPPGMWKWCTAVVLSEGGLCCVLHETA